MQGSYIAMVPVSNMHELIGMIQLQKEILRVSEDQHLFPSVGRDLSKPWMDLEMAFKDHRGTDKPHCMSYEEFEEFAVEHSGLQGPNLLSAIQYFDQIGELKYYRGIPSLHYNVFLDLEWLAKLMKLLFRHDHETALQHKNEYLAEGLDKDTFQEHTEKLRKDAELSLKLLR